MPDWHDQLSVSALCFPGMSPLDVLDTVAGIGARHTTLMAGTVLDAGPAEVAGHARAVGIAVAGLVGGIGPNLDEPGTWASGRDQVRRSTDAAAAVGATVVYTLAGARRWCPWDEAADRFAEFISPCIQHAGESDISLAIEPAMVMYADLTFVHTARDAFALAGLVPGLKVDLDLFHVWTEPDLRDNISSHISRIGLVQVGDFASNERSLPCRAVIGDGLVPVKEMVGWLSEAGYDGIVDLELNGPRIDAEGHLPAATRGAQALNDVLISQYR
jgi:sugar phosphate isomerase/epimerase